MIDLMAGIGGVNVIVTHYGGKEWTPAVPRSKRRRIRRKWRKQRRGCVRWVRHSWLVGGQLLVDPITYREMMAAIPGSAA